MKIKICIDTVNVQIENTPFTKKDKQGVVNIGGIDNEQLSHEEIDGLVARLTEGVFDSLGQAGVNADAKDCVEM